MLITFCLYVSKFFFFFKKKFFLINIYNYLSCFENNYLIENKNCKSAYQKYFLDNLICKKSLDTLSFNFNNLTTEFILNFTNVLQNNDIYYFILSI